MPDFAWSRALTANQLDDRPLANWQYRRLPYRAQVTIMQRSTTVGARQSIFAGSTNIVQRSNINGGGTAGVQPVHFNTTPIQFIGEAGDELIISNDEVAAGTPTIDGFCNIEPV